MVTMWFFDFLAHPIGRGLRFIIGVLLMVVGWLGIGFGDVLGVIVTVIGAEFMLAGLLNFCLIAPLFGQSFWGNVLRQEHHTTSSA